MINTRELQAAMRLVVAHLNGDTRVDADSIEQAKKILELAARDGEWVVYYP